MTIDAIDLARATVPTPEPRLTTLSHGGGQGKPSKNSIGVVYRLSARVNGPRGTQAFFQTMLPWQG